MRENPTYECSYLTYNKLDPPTRSSNGSPAQPRNNAHTRIFNLILEEQIDLMIDEVMAAENMLTVHTVTLTTRNE